MRPVASWVAPRRSARSGLRRHAREFLRALADLALPASCAACGTALVAGGLCAACRAHLVQRPVAGCDRCGEPVIASRCVADHRPLQGIEFAQAPFRYVGTAGALVRRLKLDGEFAALPILIAAMSGVAAPRTTAPWHRALLVPVPLHRRRRRARGFDQAQLLASGLGRRLGMPAAAGVLARRLPTLPQGDPRVTSRAANVASAFEVVRRRLVVGRRIVLVDDVFTSGATARACAAALRAAGALAVGLVTACRA